MGVRIRAGAAVGKIVLPTVASTAPVLIRRKDSRQNVLKIDHVLCDHHERVIRRAFLSAKGCAGKSPALSDRFSTGDRRQHRSSIGWLSWAENIPPLTAGEKAGFGLENI
jgi:hypothetical protein